MHFLKGVTEVDRGNGVQQGQRGNDGPAPFSIFFHVNVPDSGSLYAVGDHLQGDICEELKPQLQSESPPEPPPTPCGCSTTRSMDGHEDSFGSPVYWTMIGSDAFVVSAVSTRPTTDLRETVTHRERGQRAELESLDAIPHTREAMGHMWCRRAHYAESDVRTSALATGGSGEALANSRQQPEKYTSSLKGDLKESTKENVVRGMTTRPEAQAEPLTGTLEACIGLRP
ncbi:hypothetical protein BJV78DRAFT_1354114 [Lactifluus subvellereus]|nr:hypothetical protein BJV78DRAFT_1354114 [Lactifluus subvellereus]